MSTDPPNVNSIGDCGSINFPTSTLTISWGISNNLLLTVYDFNFNNNDACPCFLG